MSIIQEMEKHVKEFIEKPHPEFGNLPVCPFAKRARLHYQSLYVICPLHNTRRVWDEIAHWRDETQYQVLTLVDPAKYMTYKEFRKITDDFLKTCERENIEEDWKNNLCMFEAHPLSDYQDHGVYTRRDPYPNWQFIRNMTLEEAREQLKHSKWGLSESKKEGKENVS